MKFKVGDKVKFIDEKGGGVVTGIVDSRLVKVKTDDGFEMPVMSVELIPDYRAMPEKAEVPKTYVPVAPVAQEEDPTYITEINPYRKIQEEKGVYLGFEPHEQQWILTGDMDVIIANNTRYELLFNLFLKREVFEGVDFTSIPANSKYVVATITRDEIEEWTNGYIQMMFHTDKPESIYLPVHSVINIKTPRFFKEGSYKSNTIFNGRAVVINLITINSLQVVSANPAAQKEDPVISNSKATTVREKQLIDKYRTNPGEAVVDLHIGELVDNILGLSSADMISIQIDTFKKVLNNAMLNEYRKVTFIHGVGNGVLKSAIIKELKNYEGVENSMASIAKFGVGAIDITISKQ